MPISENWTCRQRSNLLKACTERGITLAIHEKLLQVMSRVSGTEAKEAQAKKLCDIITSSKTEEEMLERMDALE